MSEQYAVMKMSEYTDICDWVRDKTDTTEKIKASEIVENIEDKGRVK